MLTSSKYSVGHVPFLGDKKSLRSQKWQIEHAKSTIGLVKGISLKCENL